MTGPETLATQALEAYLAALTGVDGTRLVRDQVRTGALDDWFEDREHPKRIHVLGLGKAAPSMLWGLVEANVPFDGIGVAPRQRTRPTVDTFTWLDGDHPVPGEASFEAGRRILEWAEGFPDGEPLLVLLSGGASSLLEVPHDGDEDAARRRWEEELRAGLDIEALNARRAASSCLKGGRLGKVLLERTDRIRVWLLGDTPPGTESATVGSGPFWQADAPDSIPHTVLGDGDRMAVGAVQTLATRWSVYRYDRVDGAVEDAAEAFLRFLDGLPADQEVALIGAGEPTLVIPADAPPGGRAQHAALVAARILGETGSPAIFFAAGSDGIDGTTKEAGAWSDGTLWDPEAEEALETFDAHRFLETRGRTVRTGPSRTNVGDLWIALRPSMQAGVAVEARSSGPLVIK